VRQRLEKQLIKKAQLKNVAIDKARGPKFPEAATMRALDRQVDRTYDVIESLANEAARLPAVSPEGALAKAGLGLRVQRRYDWQPQVLELLESGIADLRAFLAWRQRPRKTQELGRAFDAHPAIGSSPGSARRDWTARQY